MRHHRTMSIIDPAFEGVGKVPGLTLWRIEKKLVVKQPVVSALIGVACRGGLESAAGGAAAHRSLKAGARARLIA